jgi:hypothetical protein
MADAARNKEFRTQNIEGNPKCKQGTAFVGLRRDAGNEE